MPKLLADFLRTVVQKIKSCPPCAIATFSVLGVLVVGRGVRSWLTYQPSRILPPPQSEAESLCVDLSASQKFLLFEESYHKGQGNIFIGIKTRGPTEEINTKLKVLQNQYAIFRSYVVQRGAYEEDQLLVKPTSASPVVPLKEIFVETEEQLDEVYQAQMEAEMFKPFAHSALLWKVVRITSKSTDQSDPRSYLIFKIHPVLLDKLSIGEFLSFFFTTFSEENDLSLDTKFPPQDEESMVPLCDLKLPTYWEILCNTLSMERRYPVRRMPFPLDRPSSPSLPRATRVQTLELTKQHTLKLQELVKEKGTNLLSTLAALITRGIISVLSKDPSKRIPESIVWQTDAVDGRPLLGRQGSVVGPLTTGVTYDIHSFIGPANKHLETWTLSQNFQKDLSRKLSSMPLHIKLWSQQQGTEAQLLTQKIARTEHDHNLRDSVCSFSLSDCGQVQSPTSGKLACKFIDLAVVNHLSGPLFHFHYVVVDGSLSLSLTHIIPLVDESSAKDLLENIQEHLSILLF